MATHLPFALAGLLLLGASCQAPAHEDAGPPLASWHDGFARESIVHFVERVTTPGSPDFVPVPERVAVFDNDGTLWSEKPVIIQLDYIIGQWAAELRRDPSLAERQPYRAVATGDLGWLGAAVEKHYAGDDSDLTI